MNIKPLDFDELDPALAEALRPRVERLGYLGDFFRYTAHQPEALRAFIDFTEASKAGLSAELVEVIALTAATRLGNDYERHQHERLAVRLGLGRDWVTAVERLEPEVLDGEAGAVQAYLLAALDHDGFGVDDKLDAVVDALGAAGAVAVMLVAARYAAHALVVNSLGLAPPVPSIFEDGPCG